MKIFKSTPRHIRNLFRETWCKASVEIRDMHTINPSSFVYLPLSYGTLNIRANNKQYLLSDDSNSLNLHVYLIGPKDEAESLAVGIHTFPFEFFVPKECPTSYEGAIGKIRYYVSARLKKLWSVDNVCLKPFTVVNPFDLNQDTRSKVIKF